MAVIVPTMHLTEAQDAARESALAALDGRRPFLLCGYAGAGKTTVSVEIVRDLLRLGKRVVATAPTHAATRVLRRKFAAAGTHAECRTIHSLLGLSPASDFAMRKLKLTGESHAHEYDVVVIDETSMIGRDLQSHIDLGCPRAVLYLGDPAQLPPVMEKIAPVFSKHIERATLTAIVRQAAGNPVLDAATAVRRQQGADLDWTWICAENDGAHGIFVPDAAATDDILRARFTDPGWDSDPDSFRALAFTNRRVAEINALVRLWRYGPTVAPFVPGERVVCRQPIYDHWRHTGKKWTRPTLFTTLEETYVRAIKSGTEIFTFEARECGWNDDGTFNESVPAWSAALPVWRVSLAHDSLGEVSTMMPHDRDRARIIDARLIAEARIHRKRWKDHYRFTEDLADLRPPFAMTVHCSQGATFGSVAISMDDVITARGDALTKQKLCYTALTRPREAAILMGVQP